jgi:hypothetical protein
MPVRIEFLRKYEAAGDVSETHEAAGDFREFTFVLSLPWRS